MSDAAPSPRKSAPASKSPTPTPAAKGGEEAIKKFKPHGAQIRLAESAFREWRVSVPQANISDAILDEIVEPNFLERRISDSVGAQGIRPGDRVSMHDENFRHFYAEFLVTQVDLVARSAKLVPLSVTDLSRVKRLFTDLSHCVIEETSADGWRVMHAIDLSDVARVLLVLESGVCVVAQWREGDIGGGELAEAWFLTEGKTLPLPDGRFWVGICEPLAMCPLGATGTH